VDEMNINTVGESYLARYRMLPEKRWLYPIRITIDTPIFAIKEMLRDD
jgi:hypothetical protein